MEDVWRGEAQDLLTQIAQLQEENKQLMTNLSHKDINFTEEEFQKHEGKFVTSNSRLAFVIKSNTLSKHFAWLFWLFSYGLIQLWIVEAGFAVCFFHLNRKSLNT